MCTTSDISKYVLVHLLLFSRAVHISFFIFLFPSNGILLPIDMTRHSKPVFSQEHKKIEAKLTVPFLGLGQMIWLQIVLEIIRCSAVLRVTSFQSLLKSILLLSLLVFIVLLLH